MDGALVTDNLAWFNIRKEEFENLGLVHTYPDIFDSATFSFRIKKFPHPHVSDGIQIHSSTQSSSALKCLQNMRRRAR